MKNHLSLHSLALPCTPLHSLIIIPLALLALLSSCHKDCVCQGYDGSSHTYTEEEVDARGVTCSDMIFLEGSLYRFYSVCEWE